MWRTSLIVTVFLVAACLTEAKPYLKPAQQHDIPHRIANLQKWLDQDITAKAISGVDAKPIQDKLNKVKEKYDRLQSAGALSAKDSEAISKTLDEISDLIFRTALKGERKKSLFK
jgi:hypothetical protein